MGRDSAIEWTHHTFNPWRGCAKVSPGCTHCYAETLSKRNPAVLGTWGKDGTRAIAAEAYWRQPLAWERAAAKDGERRRVFCASLADVFEDRDDLLPARVRLFETIDRTPALDWLLLTKRPENVKRLLSTTKQTAHGWDDLPRNVWLGTSVENQATADARIPHLLTVPAAVRFLSVEPLLERVDLGLDAIERDDDGKAWFRHGREDMHPCDYSCPNGGEIQGGVDWVIVGGESGHGARLCGVEWIRDVVRQCREAGVACFVKQLGSRPFDGYARGPDGEPNEPYETDENGQRLVSDRKGGDPQEWPEDIRVRAFPR